jgi:hypothetical protein
MAKHIVKGFVTYRAPEEWETGPRIGFADFPVSDGNTVWGFVVAPLDIEVEVPDGFDPRPQQIAALDAKIEEARAAFTARLTELQDQKNRLLAIENTVEA